MSEVTNREFRETQPSHLKSKRALKYAFGVFFTSSLVTELLTGCAPPKETPPKETEAPNLLKTLLKEAEPYSTIETKEAQELLGLEELVVVDASQVFDVAVDWEKVSQLPDVELLKGKKLAIIFVDEYLPSDKKLLTEENPNSPPQEESSAHTIIMPDGQMIMVFDINVASAINLPEGVPDDYRGDLYQEFAFLHELRHVLLVCKMGFEEYFSLSEDERERKAHEYAKANQLRFLYGVKLKLDKESRLTPQEELEVQAFLHWLGVQGSVLGYKGEVPYFLRSKV